MLAREYIEINNLKIAYSDIGKGAPVLLVHGFACSSFSWERIIPYLPKNRRYIMPDLKGFGYSDKSLDNNFSPFYQAKMLIQFAKKLKLKKIVLVGHSFGGAVSLISLFSQEMRKDVDKLILIDSGGYFNQLPPFIKQLRIPLANNLVFNFVNSEILTKVILEEAYFDKSKIDEEYVREYSSLLRLPGAIDCLIQSANKISIGKPNALSRRLKQIEIPTLIIWGEQDQFIPVQDAYHLQEDLKNSEFAIIPKCGHSPHEEKPEDTGGIISDFINGKNLRIPTDPKIYDNPLNQTQKIKVAPYSKYLKLKSPKMSAMINKWSPTIFIMFVFVKILQVLRTIGFKAKESGWRKTMGAYLRTEHSKFGLAVFGLDFLSDRGKLEQLPYKKARLHVIERLAEFLREAPSSQWKLRWEKFAVFRERHLFTDVMDAEFDDEGNMIKLTPYFDEKSPPFYKIKEEDFKELTKLIVEEYNRVKDYRDENRPRILKKNLHKWVKSKPELSKMVKSETLSFIDRVLSGNWIIFQTLEKKASGSTAERFTPPDFIKHKHPGFGLLNIFCRFNHSLDEADFWFQFQHVPVDGVPMQEFLLNLKKRWGIRRNLVYPSISSTKDIKPQRCSTSKKKEALYQTITFIDFRPLLKLRKKINKEYGNEMGGPATVISLVMWGLTQHSSLKDRKFIFPVELAECPITKQERAPSAMFIRPSQFANLKNPIKGFCDFQFEFNRMMNATRARKSESYEFIELYALTFPLLYTFTRKMMPEALGEFVGTVGITMIKDADLFITPLSDIQSDGFFAIGNLLVDTEDGNKAGCVSIRATEEKLPHYIDACDKVQESLDNFFQKGETQ